MIIRRALALTLGSALVFSTATLAHATQTQADSHEHSHSHDHSEEAKKVYDGYFDDSQIKPRPLSDWDGDWQSVYPYLMDGALDPVMQHKAEHGGKSAKEYRDYYEIGYKTDVYRIVIEGDDVTFYRNEKALKATYASDGFEVLTYEKGNRGVRFIFKKTGGDEAAPKFIQFSDHIIAPEKAGHYHLYWGDDRAKLLKELTNWPTYYPASLSGKQIVHEMLEH
ncbi:metal-binding protein ZinT [Agrobacterium larrymoorei]|uniref:ZinT family metal-binding protein n=1 Tax=Agrobacterium larrymoorei TaxID=160699 RepID=UPI00157356FD|nr:metal-binding protein ZinT [Agrobacterium larrymoorei]NTJ43253.1 metal-binding protein ZinT [Agrobacterium larrymoorei]